MEPAVERREDAATISGARTAFPAPQWSPPLKGGRTLRADRVRDRRGLAAMEPAVERREDGCELNEWAKSRRCRNGARR